MNDASERGPDNGDFLRRFSQELPVVLNDGELQLYGRMLAEKVREEELADEAKKQETSRRATAIKSIRNDVKRLADARAKGEELRAVPCGERLKGNVIEIVRLDRMEVVSTRPAEIRDLQTDMPGMGVPEDFDEGPSLGGPSKTGRTVDPKLDDEPGEMVESSSGDQVYSGAPDDVDDDTLICDACGEVVSDQESTAVVDGSTVHARCIDAASNMDAGDKSENAEHVNGSRSKPKRDRSKKSNAAKKPAPKRKR